MKKDLLFSLNVLTTFFAGIPGITAYQSHSSQYKTYSLNYNTHKRSGSIFENLIPKQTFDIIAIICGRNLKFLDKLINFEYKKRCSFIAGRAGRAGIISMMLDFDFTKFWGRNLANYHTISVSQKTEG